MNGLLPTPVWAIVRAQSHGSRGRFGARLHRRDPDPAVFEPQGVELGERGVNASETLRRTARELIDRLPALELPAAIAYMQYLQERMPSVIEPAP